MIPNLNNRVLLSFVVRAVLWGLTYYFIRRALNPTTTDLEKFQSDAIYGAVASFVSAIAFWYIDKVINFVDSGY